MKWFLGFFKGQSRTTLILRVVAGGYLVYLGYQLFTSDPEGNVSRWLIWVVPVVFWFFGGAFLIAALYEMTRQHYETLAAAAMSEDEDDYGRPLVLKNYEKKIMDLFKIQYEKTEDDCESAPETEPEPSSDSISEDNIE